MKKFFGSLIFILIISQGVSAQILEFNQCWVKKEKNLDQNWKKYEFKYNNINEYNKSENIEFQKFSINANTSSLVRTIKYSKENRMFPDDLKQISIPIASWDNEYLKAFGAEVLRNGTLNTRQFILNMNTGEIRYTQRLTENSSGKFYMKNEYQIVCNDMQGNTASGSDGSSSGTAFFVSNKGHLLTNNHVVEGCELSKISFKNKDYDAKLIATDKTLDLALLKANIRSSTYFSFSNEDANKLNKIYVAGFPLGKGLSDDLKISSGIVSALKGFEDNSNEIQIDAPINPGNSGGPIINESGELVAIAVSGLAKDQTEGINFGIKSSAAESFLNSNKIKPKKSLYSRKLNNDKLLDILEKGTVYTYCD